MGILTRKDKSSKEKSEIEKEIILENLSFYEWMNLEKILIGLNASDMTLLEDFEFGELEDLLNSLCKDGHLETKSESKETFYKRIIKKKSLIEKVKSKL